MGATKTENSHLEEKITIRLQAIEGLESPVRVLDAFAADGRLWQNIQSRTEKQLLITPIETRAISNRLYLHGDNRKFIASMNLSRYDVIDLDAYGVPFGQLEMIFEKGFSGIVCVTFIQSVMGNLPHDFLRQLGYPKAMIQKCPTMFYANGMEKMEQYLAQKGVQKITGYFLSDRKNYFYFSLAQLADNEYIVG